ncbi:divalent metal cation transporter [Patescibacteria group bacterium]|nr:divalent metal cation transporter [Patescibacteria group bacterium]
MLGPGLTTGAVDDDPGGIVVYSQAGAGYGFKMLWLAPFTFPLMAVVQEMCARIGLVTGQGLAANIKQYYPKRTLYFVTALLFFANAFNIGADLKAMVKATQLLFPSLGFGLLISVFVAISLILQIFMTYQGYAKYLKWLSLILVSYIFSAISIQANWNEIMRQAITLSFASSGAEVLMIMAILGTTISPYLFFWQTSQEVEEEILSGKTTIAERLGTTADALRKMRIDVWSGMFFSNLIMFFIIVVSGSVLFSHGITDIRTAADAAEALRPFAGEWTYVLFTLGIIGTGLLAIPVLAASASYALSESFNWPQGLYHKLKEASAFYGIIIISMLVGLAINFTGIDAIRALIYSAVLNGFVAPVVLILMVQIANSKKIMGEWVNHPVIGWLGWCIAGMMAVVSVATIAVLL